MTRSEAIARIKAALESRTKTPFSVTGGRSRSSDWGWITIHSIPSRRSEFGYMNEAERIELEDLLGISVDCQGVSVPATSKHYQEYVDRAEGREPSVIGEAYWD